MTKKRFTFSLLTLLLLLCAAAAFFLRGCAAPSDGEEAATVRTDTVAGMVMQMQRCSRLQVAELKVHKIITHDDALKLSGTLLGKELSVNIPAGKRKVAIPLCATIKASIDLTKVTAADIRHYDGKVEVFLPQPDVVITETHIDHDGIRQYVAMTRSNFTDEELQAYERQGREAIENDIPRMNITQMARESAARQLIPIIMAAGFNETDVTITFRDHGKTNTLLRKHE